MPTCCKRHIDAAPKGKFLSDTRLDAASQHPEHVKRAPVTLGFGYGLPVMMSGNACVGVLTCDRRVFPPSFRIAGLEGVRKNTGPALLDWGSGFRVWG